MRTALLCALLILTSLRVFADEREAQLVGHWRFANERFSYEYYFGDDGTFSGSVTRDGQLAWAFAGKYRIEDDAIIYEYTKSSLERIPDGTYDRDKLVELDKDHYLIEAQDGMRRKYERVEER